MWSEMTIPALFRRWLIVPIAVAAFTVGLLAPLAGAADAHGSHAAKAKLVVKRVNVIDDAFRPGKLTIKVGQAVDFVWSDNNFDSHNVTLLSGPKGVNKHKFTSITGSTGLHFQRTFTIAGKYHFYCTIHPTMMNLYLTVTK